MGKTLMLSLDCKACHTIDVKSVGPTYTAVAQRYQKNTDATTYLAEKMIKGSSGVWGEVAMPAHPDLKENDAKQIATWILSLGAEKSKIKSLPASGSLNPTLNKPLKDKGKLYISASYTDKGGTNIKPLTGNYTVQLRSNKITFENVENMQGFSKVNFNSVTYLMLPVSGWFSIDSIDLTNVQRLSARIGWQQPPVLPYTFEIHLDSPAGKKLGEFQFEGVGGETGKQEEPKKAQQGFKLLSTTIEKVSDGKLHNVFIVAKAKNNEGKNTPALAYVEFNAK